MKSESNHLESVWHRFRLVENGKSRKSEHGEVVRKTENRLSKLTNIVTFSIVEKIEKVKLPLFHLELPTFVWIIWSRKRGQLSWEMETEIYDKMAPRTRLTFLGIKSSPTFFGDKMKS